MFEFLYAVGGFILDFALWSLAIIGLVGLAFIVVLLVEILRMIVKDMEDDCCG